MPKHVVSSTLTDPLARSGATRLTGELTAAVTELERGDGGPILVHGSATLARALLAAGLVDDLRLMTFPVLVDGGRWAVGGGQSIYPTSFGKGTFTLATSEQVFPDVVALTYTRVA